jgi:ribosome assembly protein YihI (activator of Der GTPase)
MTRKKSRKIGQIGIPKANTPRPVKTEDRTRTKKGNKSGTRQQMTELRPDTNKNSQTDRKLGSKKAIDLSKYEAGKQSNNKTKTPDSEPVKYETPQAELDAIESDIKLEALLEKREIGKLTGSEQTYVDTKTSRYRDLCELMGIDVDEYNDDAEEEIEQEDDPFAKLDAIKLDDFKD